MLPSSTLKWTLPAGIALSPLILLHSLLDPDQTVRFIYLTLLGAGILLLYLNSKDQFTHVLHWKNPVLICLLVWLVATLLSSSVALQRSEALVECARVFFLLFSYIWMTLYLKSDSKGAFCLSLGFCVAGVLLSGIGMKDMMESWASVSSAGGYYQITGNMGNRNLLAIMLSLCLPFHFIAFTQAQSKYAKTALALSFALALLVISATSSRVGWLALAVLFMIVLMVIAILFFKKQLASTHLKKITATLAGAVLLVAVALTFLLNNPNTSNAVRERLQSFYNFSSQDNMHNESINERLLLWSNSLELIKEHPFLGVGAGNWKFRYPEKSLSGRTAQGDVLFQQPHNDFLWTFSETGLAGGIAFALLFAITFIVAVRALLKGKPAELAISIAVLGGISMYAVHSFFDFPKERPLILFAFAALLALGSSLQNIKKTQSANLMFQRFLIIACITASIVSVLFWYQRMQGEIALKKAFAARQQGNFNSTKQLLGKVSPFFFESDLNGTPLAWYKGEAEYRLGNLKESERHFKDALKISPYHLYAHYNLGAIYYYQKKIPAAIQSWQQALRIAPGFSDAAVNLSAAYYNLGDLENAAVALSKVKIDYSKPQNTAVVTAVLSQYISMLKDSVSHPALVTALNEIRLDNRLLPELQFLMKRNNKHPKEVILNVAIARAKEQQTLSASDADSLRVFYGLNEK